MSAAPKCANCGDSGRNPGSEYLDCTRCDAAELHAELGRFLVSHYADPACAWKVHQRAYAMGVAAAVPEGWQLVPTQLTAPMRSEIRLISEFTDQAMQFRYAAMLNAAPKVKP